MAIIQYVQDLVHNKKIRNEISEALAFYWVSQDEDENLFQIEGFYQFCKQSPKGYSFTEIARAPELDEIIIGLWLKNHDCENQ